MTRLVSISGAQGCGKSTTIKLLYTKHQLAYDAISIPRFVQQQLGYSTLAEVLLEPIETIKRYQLQILEAKYNRDSTNLKCAIDSNSVIIVERNFADIFAFATQWAINSADKDFIEWTQTEYKSKCIEYQRNIDYISVILSPLATFEIDPRRAAEISRFDINTRIRSFITELAMKHDESTAEFILLDDLDLNVRVEKINALIRS